MRIINLFCLILFFISGYIQAQQNFVFTFKNPQELQQFLRYNTRFPPYVHAHRGGGYDNYPENCIETFDYTLKQIPAFMEIDPRVTKDGIIVLMHDATLDRTTNTTGKVSDYTYKELQTFFLKDKNGQVTRYKIPTLQEALRWAKGKSVLIIDKKDAPVSQILKLIKEEKAEAHVILMAYTLDDANLILQYNPRLTLQVFAKDEEALKRIERNNIPLDNVVAFVSHVYPADQRIFALLHQKNVKAIVGTSRNLDMEFVKENNSVYASLIEEDVDIIEADSAINAGNELLKLWEEEAIINKYITFDK